MKVEIGQKLYKVKARRGLPTEIVEMIVTKLGKKYFYCNNSEVSKFSFQNLRYENKEYSQCSIQLYLTKQEILDMWELSTLNSKCKEAFNYWGPPQFSLDQLRKVSEILQLNKGGVAI